ncbi:MAG: SCO1664 family protein [Anaerolineae bacterium]|nr:SCO1664 family protein [Anaerolineae bacterium]
MPTSPDPNILATLERCEFTLEGEFTQGLNYTFLTKIKSTEDRVIQAVYKPQQGERPLWDFPDDTLAHREAAAYLVSEALGWQLVPPTAYRDDGPFGPGSLQLFIEHDPSYHYFNIRNEDFERLRPVVLFDLLINNADRKGSHLIFAPDNHLWLIDHGLCFHVDDKLRTVMWDFAGEAIPSALKSDLTKFQQALKENTGIASGLSAHLSPEEFTKLQARSEWLNQLKTFPFPPPDRRAYPFPPL